MKGNGGLSSARLRWHAVGVVSVCYGHGHYVLCVCSHHMPCVRPVL